MAVRHAGDQAFATWAAAIAASHVGGRAGLVDEDQTGSVQCWLLIAPHPAGFGNIRSLLLRGMVGLFLSVSSRRSSVFHKQPMLTRTLNSASSHACNSASVASGSARTR